MSSDSMRPIGDALGAVRRDLGLGRPGTIDALIAAWPSLVGDALAAHSRPRALRDGVLAIVVDGPAWAGQLKYLDSVLVERIAAEVPIAEVHEVRVSVGPLEVPGTGPTLA